MLNTKKREQNLGLCYIRALWVASGLVTGGQPGYGSL